MPVKERIVRQVKYLVERELIQEGLLPNTAESIAVYVANKTAIALQEAIETALLIAEEYKRRNDTPPIDSSP